MGTRGITFAAITAPFWAAVSATALTVDGRELRVAGGVFVAEDAEWLLARARYYLAEGDYGRANDLATLLASAAPADINLAAQAFNARTKYFAVGHKESYLAFKKLYEEEKKRREAYASAGQPASLSEGDKARLAVISAEAVATLGTAYGAGAVSGVNAISAYDSPTANTGVAEPQPTRYDLRWSVNLYFLIKEHDKEAAAAARTALKCAIDERRTFSAFFRDVSMPKDTATRAADDVRGSVMARAQKFLPGALAREIQNTYNLEGFKFCTPAPLGIPELTAYAGRAMKLNDQVEVKVEKYQEAGFVAYRATATARAELTASLAEIITALGADPYVWRPFVGPLEEKTSKAPGDSETSPATLQLLDSGGIPEE